MQNKIFRFAFFFLSFLLIFQWLGKSRQTEATPLNGVIIQSEDSIALGDSVDLKLINYLANPIELSLNCPSSSFKIEKYVNGQWLALSLPAESVCEPDLISVSPNQEVSISFSERGYLLFDEVGKYRVAYSLQLEGVDKEYFHDFEIASPSLVRQMFREFLYKPIFNTLILIVSKLPGNSLGWGIILLTLIIKIILLIPNQKALRSQKKMQQIQPQLEALRTKYKEDPQRLAQETMAIWKKNKVSPAGSCMPMLIQFPILIALFYVVRDGLDGSHSLLLYEGLKSFDMQSVNYLFLNILDLTQRNIIVLPIIVASLQFTQIRLSFGRMKSKPDSANPMMNMNKMMQYFMPVMIGVFTASLPAAVGLYWGTSTLFSIFQQMVVNYTKD